MEQNTTLVFTILTLIQIYYRIYPIELVKSSTLKSIIQLLTFDTSDNPRITIKESVFSNYYIMNFHFILNETLKCLQHSTQLSIL